MARVGRSPDHLKILPGALVFVGDTHAEAQGQEGARSTAWSIPTAASRTCRCGWASTRPGFDLDGPLPEIPETNASKSGRQNLIDLARRENLTVGQLAQLVGAYGGLEMIGTPAMIADQMQEWLEGDGCDGFNVMFPYVPGGLDDFVDLVVPELQRRGLFRREYEGVTLRENLGLPRPANRFFPKG